MQIENKRIILEEDDLKEIYSLWCNVDSYLKREMYKPDSSYYYKKEDLSEEHSFSMEKREYAWDMWDAVMFFLDIKGFALEKGGKRFDLGWIREELLK